MPTLDEVINGIVYKYASDHDKRLHARRTERDQDKGRIRVKINDFDKRSMRELEDAKFSGLRANQIWNRFELWILGRLHDSLPFSTFMQRPSSLIDFYCEAFGIEKAQLEDETHRAVLEAEARKVSAMVADRTMRGLSHDGSGAGSGEVTVYPVATQALGTPSENRILPSDDGTIQDRLPRDGHEKLPE